MKKFILILGVLPILSVLADDAYEFVSGGYQILADKKNYIQINEDLEAFSLSSDFGSIGNSGKVGYYVYEGELGTSELLSKINESRRAGNTFKKADGSIDITNVSAGDKIGFYLVRNSGIVQTDWRFVTYGNGTSGISFNSFGFGKDDIMLFGDIAVVKQSQGSNTTGMPLPGFLPALMVGGLGLGGFGLRRLRWRKA